MKITTTEHFIIFIKYDWIVRYCIDFCIDDFFGMFDRLITSSVDLRHTPEGIWILNTKFLEISKFATV